VSAQVTVPAVWSVDVALPANEWAEIKHNKTQMTRENLCMPRIAAQTGRNFKLIRR